VDSFITSPSWPEAQCGRCICKIYTKDMDGVDALPSSCDRVRAARLGAMLLHVDTPAAQSRVHHQRTRTARGGQGGGIQAL
jgi:hypothetical protein